MLKLTIRLQTNLLSSVTLHNMKIHKLLKFTVSKKTPLTIDVTSLDSIKLITEKIGIMKQEQL